MRFTPAAELNVGTLPQMPQLPRMSSSCRRDIDDHCVGIGPVKLLLAAFKGIPYWLWRVRCSVFTNARTRACRKPFGVSACLGRLSVRQQTPALRTE